MKLTKQETKFHLQAEDLINSEKELSFDEKIFILENWIPGANNNVTESGSFFTPYELAQDLAIAFYDEPYKIIDLCAGIGTLSFAYLQKVKIVGTPDLTCVEINPEFVKVGKRILPEAKWILGNVFELYENGTLKEKYDGCLSNPPFGAISKKISKPKNIKGSIWEYAIAEIGCSLAGEATMIVSQGALNWRFSGRTQFQEVNNDRYKTWNSKTGIFLENALAIDTSVYKFKGANVRVEIVNAIRN